MRWSDDASTHERTRALCGRILFVCLPIFVNNSNDETNINSNAVASLRTRATQVSIAASGFCKDLDCVGDCPAGLLQGYSTTRTRLPRRASARLLCCSCKRNKLKTFENCTYSQTKQYKYKWRGQNHAPWVLAPRAHVCDCHAWRL